MPRISSSFSIIAALLVVVLVLGWRLYALETAGEDVRADARPLAEHAPPPRDSHAGASADGMISSRLAAIDTRLSAIESRQETARTGAKNQTEVKKTISPQAAARANQRLAAIVPGGNFDQNAMAGFHVALGSLPEDERIALAAALTQAINEGRIKPRK
jgi:hypothetical protein